MPEHLRALIVILVLATIVFAFAHRPACAIAGTRDFTRRRNLWYALTITAFLAHSFWIYALIAVPLLIYAYSRETNVAALFFFILFALPSDSISIPGMGLINYFFDLSHVRILALVVLLPAFFALLLRRNTTPFGRMAPDKVLAAYILLTVALYLRQTTMTDTARQAFYMFIDVFLPYFVISRSLKDLQGFRAALLSFVVAIMVLALVAVFEAARHWILYQPLVGALGLHGTYGHGYLLRDGILRAIATAEQPIALGYLMVTGLGFYLFVKRSIKQKSIRALGLVLLVAGLIASLSRGPWVGAVALVIIFIALGRNAVPRVVGFVMAGIVTISLAAVLPGGEKVFNMLPVIGKTEQGTIEGRQDLLEVSIRVIERHPWLGSVDYLKTPEMESMRTGLGIIDIVNTYIRIALETGLVGLSLFVGFFVLMLVGIFRAMRSVRDRNSEERQLGQALLATLLSILLIIFTVSSITFIPYVYWSVAGMGLAYILMVRNQARAAARETAPQAPKAGTPPHPRARPVTGNRDRGARAMKQTK